MEFSTTLKELRQEKKLTQKELAKACNLSPQCISALEKGINSPTATTLTALSKFFDIPINELMGIEYSINHLIPKSDETQKINITPIEEQMLDIFREIGLKHGKEAQLALITVAEKMI